MKLVSSKLEQARAYEACHGGAISAEMRPLFHVTPTVGWLNDPNGFSVYKGEYHIFYQYHPYSVQWGPMHWGHSKSADLLHWQRLPAAMAPDQVYDQYGCFSGSAMETEDGQHLLMYTGVQEVPQEDGTVKRYQTQCIALGDGLNYEKHPANPVITAEQLPKGGSPYDFRDPKVWKEGDTWYAVLANRTEDGSGAIWLYSSEDAVHWQRVRAMDRSNNQHGRMWECPDLFELDGWGVLLTSAQELETQDLTFHNGNEVLCLTGEYDREDHRFRRTALQPVDQGLDFYAPQTLLTPDGRRVMLAWMQSWEASTMVPRGQQWFGMLSLPRELHVREGRLVQTPLRELEACRRRPVQYRDVPLTGQRTLPGVSGRELDLAVQVRQGAGEAYASFTLKLAQDDTYYTSLTFDRTNGQLTLDRTFSGFPYNIVHRRTVPVCSRQTDELKLRVILDRFSAEIFVNDGVQVLSATLYTPQQADGITFEASGCCLLDVEKYDLEL